MHVHYSYFSLISHDPAMLTVAFTLSTQRPKDTRENILATGQFVVNIISEPYVLLHLSSHIQNL